GLCACETLAVVSAAVGVAEDLQRRADQRKSRDFAVRRPDPASHGRQRNLGLGSGRGPRRTDAPLVAPGAGLHRASTGRSACPLGGWTYTGRHCRGRRAEAAGLAAPLASSGLHELCGGLAARGSRAPLAVGGALARARSDAADGAGQSESAASW